MLDEIETMEPDSPVIHDEADTEEIYDADRNIVLESKLSEVTLKTVLK